MDAPILAPVIALAAWTQVMMLVMYAYRIPAILQLKLKMDNTNPELMKVLPPSVRWKADNYNHLHEQPTVFYAVAIALAIMGAGSGVNAQLAWLYVALRVVHSLIQISYNNIRIRFYTFTVTSLVLMALVVRAGLLVLGKNQLL